MKFNVQKKISLNANLDRCFAVNMVYCKKQNCVTEKGSASEHCWNVDTDNSV